MSWFSRKSNNAVEAMTSAKVSSIGKDINQFQIQDLILRLSALEEYLGIYAVNNPQRYVYKKRGEALGGIGSALTGSSSPTPR